MNRRKKDDHVFLVAYYQCNDDYDLESLDNDRLYCSKETWIGDRPNCISLSEDGDEGDEENDGKCVLRESNLCFR